jgi:hypothetical protein
MTITEISGMLFSDQLGWFPITSNRGNKHIIMFYIYDANFVKFVPIKSRSKEELLRAYPLVYVYLTAWGFKLQLHKMDNKTSHDIKTFIREEENTHLQYTPPNIHHTNLAEREICTWKNHFLSGISGLPKAFPIANWCHLTNQTDFTLIMFWPCHQNPALLAFEALGGSYSFNATPMALSGTKVLAHHKPNRQSSRDFYALNMWYITPSLQHY